MVKAIFSHLSWFSWPRPESHRKSCVLTGKKKTWLILTRIDASEIKKIVLQLPGVRVKTLTRVGLFIKDHLMSDKFRFEWA